MFSEIQLIRWVQTPGKVNASWGNQARHPTREWEALGKVPLRWIPGFCGRKGREPGSLPPLWCLWGCCGGWVRLNAPGFCICPWGSILSSEGGGAGSFRLPGSNNQLRLSRGSSVCLQKDHYLCYCFLFSFWPRDFRSNSKPCHELVQHLKGLATMTENPCLISRMHKLSSDLCAPPPHTNNKI